MKRLLPVAAAIGAGLLVAIFVLPWVVGRAAPHLYHGTVLQQSSPAPAMDGISFASGDPVELQAFGGDITLIYFGYTGCPDVCPTTLSMVNQAIDELAVSDQERVRLLMLSVDPERDHATALHEYTQFFHPSFHGVRGDLNATRNVAAQYGIFFDYGEPDADGDYFVDHTATLMAIDVDGVLRLVWSPTVTADEVAQDIKELLK